MGLVARMSATILAEYAAAARKIKDTRDKDFLLANDKGVTVYTKPEYFDCDLKPALSSVSVAIPVGVSYEYEQVVLDARYHFPLTKAMETIDTRNRLFTLTVGYRF